MKMFKEVIITGKNHGRKFSADIRWAADGVKKPVVLFIHGFKGFKDWGTFSIIADRFAETGFIFVKMNLSHNGVTIDNPVDFADLTAFSENTFSLEMEDIRDMIDFIHSESFPVPHSEVSAEELFLIGHSRGGASALIYGSEDSRIKAVCGWAAVCDLESRWPEDQLTIWKQMGTIYIPNARTGQDMPMKYSIVEDYFENIQRFRIPDRLRSMNKPVLLIHGTEDETVTLEETRQAIRDINNVELEIIEDANHVFGATHPFEGSDLPFHTKQVVKRSIRFLSSVTAG